MLLSNAVGSGLFFFGNRQEQQDIPGFFTGLPTQFSSSTYALFPRHGLGVILFGNLEKTQYGKILGDQGGRREGFYTSSF